MKRLILILILFLFINISQAGIIMTPTADGLTFLADYTTSKIDSIKSAGSPTAIFTATRGVSNPATYIDSNGVVRLVTTSNVPRYAAGYYDATGFHTATTGVMIETAATNLIPKSYTYNDATWDLTNMTASDASASSPDGNNNASTLTATANNATILLHTAVTAQTYSVWLKRKTGTGTVSITANGGTGYTTVTLSDATWARYQVMATSASQTCGIKIATSGDAIYAWVSQFETSPYMTSSIPTTNGALTRNAEVLKYVISGNRNAANESIIVKFMLLGGSFANDTIIRSLISTDTKIRDMLKTGTGTVMRHRPNANDSPAVAINATTIPLLNTDYVIGSVFQHSSPYIVAYHNGSSESSYTTGDYTNPAWGTYFYVGSDNTGTGQINGVIKKVIIFNRALTSNEIINITNYLNQ